MENEESTEVAESASRKAAIMAENATLTQKQERAIAALLSPGNPTVVGGGDGQKARIDTNCA